ncbi:MAG TPA: histidine--tRNA ligase [Actinomycetota bacterium]|nr:histidine--tRNA ligase [Actinomycetota bacterium]
MAELAPPRGTQDLLAARADAMLGLYEEAHRLANLFGFRYLETPTFEHTELFARAAGETSDVATKEMYTFEDKGGRSLTLRPEMTPGIVRAYLDHAHELGTPFRAYFVGTSFRHGRPQTGRLREFRQFDVEVLGDASPGSDIEVIQLADRFLRGRGLERLTLKLNSIGDPVCRPAYRERLIAYLEPHAHELDDDCRVRLRVNPLRVFDCKVDGDKDLVLAAPTVTEHLCEACEAHFAGVRAGLDRADIAYEIDPRLVRGLDYYTRTAFEFVSGVLAGSKQGTVCGGGRYDGLAEVLGGPPTPGTGFGLGLDRVRLALEGEGQAPPPERSPAVFVVSIGPGAQGRAEALVDELRAAGVSASRAYAERPLKAQLRMADRAGAAHAAILGEREAAEGIVTLRRLADGTQEEVPVGDVVKVLAERGTD